MVRSEGDVAAVFSGSPKTIEASYYVPHLAHVSMEPPVAVASFKDGKVTVWAPTQDPQAAQATVGKAKGSPASHLPALLGPGSSRH